MNSIAVGFDGTEASWAALDWAAEHASRGPSRVAIVVIADTAQRDDSPMDAAIRTAERRVRASAHDVDVTSHRHAGRMPESLCEHASTADMLVVGSHRGRPQRSGHTGSQALRITSHSRIPVIVVPDDWSPTRGPVVVGLDDDDSSRAAMDVAAAEASYAGVSLAVVHAWQMPTPRIEGSIALLASPIHVKAEHRKILREAIGRVTALHPDLPIEHLLVRENAGVALLQRAKDASLLVIGTHHRGPLSRAFLGSVGQDVLARSPIPVCVAPNDSSI